MGLAVSWAVWVRPIPANWAVGGSLLGMGDACFGDWGVSGFKSILGGIIRCSLLLFLILLLLICHSLSDGKKGDFYAMTKWKIYSKVINYKKKMQHLSIF
jgi:hypothetical protein